MNLGSNCFSPDNCIFYSHHAVTLEEVSGHPLASRQRGYYKSAELVAPDFWDAGKVVKVVLKDDYFFRAERRYDLYLGFPGLRKIRVAPVGHGRCFLLQSGPLEHPDFFFLYAGFKIAEEFFKAKGYSKMWRRCDHC